MDLFEVYTRDVVLKEFWDKLEEDLTLNEAEGLPNLLNEANTVIFEKFKINPTDKVYFIAGSARLYLYPELREAFGLTGEIGDLDMIIPDKKLWLQAGLEKEWNEGGIYRPTAEIEVFNVWAPARSGNAYADTKVRTTAEILGDASLIKGYFYMAMFDIMDYKTSLNREKEQDVVNLVRQYQQHDIPNKADFLRRMARLIGWEQTKRFLSLVKK